MVNTLILQQKYKPHFELPKNSCQDYTKRNTETDTTAVRGRETYTCSTKNSELGIFQAGQNVSSTNVT